MKWCWSSLSIVAINSVLSFFSHSLHQWRSCWKTKSTSFFLVAKVTSGKKSLRLVVCEERKGNCRSSEEKRVVGWEGEKRKVGETEKSRKGRERCKGEWIGASARDVCSVFLLDPDAIFFFFYVVPFSMLFQAVRWRISCKTTVARGWRPAGCF